MGAMHLGLEARDDAGAALAAFYTERAGDSLGLMVTGGAAVSAAGSGGPRYGVLTDKAFAARLARVVESVHDAGGLIALQLFHAGRYAPRSGAGPVAPSPVFSRISGCEPRALTSSEIAATIADFVRGAAIARSLGFDAIEIMGSEGYLIDQFLSPVTNQRDDDWGGDPERRMRFGLEVTSRVRAGVGAQFPVIFRMTGMDLMPGGVPPDEVLAFARALALRGADALNIGIGWHESPVPTVQAIVPPGTWAPVAAAVRTTIAAQASAAGIAAIAVIASNRVNRLEIAEQILADGKADFVSMARPFLADPRLMSSSRAGTPVNICIGCNQACIDRSVADTGDPVSCMVNPRAARELDMPFLFRAATAARVAVIGGGPSGLAAARDLALAGHQVSLFEAAGGLGGQFRLAARVPGKNDYAATVEYMAAELMAHDAKVTLGRPVTEADEDMLRWFDGIVIATGTRPRRLKIPGTELPHVLSYPDAFTAGLGSRVVILGGGGVAVDVAHFISHTSRHEVTILHRGPRIGARIGKTTRWAVLAALRERGVNIQTNVRCEQITAEGVTYAEASGKLGLRAADTVIVAIGQEAEDSLATVIRRAGIPHHVVGGARDPSSLDAVRAISEGVAAAREFASHPITYCGTPGKTWTDGS